MSAYEYARAKFLALMAQEGMPPYLSHGALLGLSGGKDSVLLLLLFSEYAREKEIPFAAMHLHHGIRGAEADRDADFCQALCERLSVQLVLLHADIPHAAEQSGEGLEMTARRERYRLLEQTAREKGYTAILTAHTATDLAETVLFQMLRGGGTRALCGIPPVRAQGSGLFVLRPLLSLSSEEVLSALEARGASYVTDSTNQDVGYTRNYLREAVFPLLKNIMPSPERAILRMTENVREDAAFLDDLAQVRFDELFCDDSLDADGFYALPAALRFRVIRLFYAKCMEGAPLPEQTHVHALTELLSHTEDFSLSMPGDISLSRFGSRLTFGKNIPFSHPHTPIRKGCNRLADGSYLWLLDESSTPLPEIVYTLSTQRDLSSATIEGELYVRSRLEGDAYRFGGMTHKLKKMFSDRKIPSHLRSHVPVLCDGRGILWVPPFGVREDGARGGHLTAVFLSKEKMTCDVADLLCDLTE